MPEDLFSFLSVTNNTAKNSVVQSLAFFDSFIIIIIIIMRHLLFKSRHPSTHPLASHLLFQSPTAPPAERSGGG